MKIAQISRRQADFPKQLLAAQPVPKQIFYLGARPAEWLDRPKVAVVGSRKFTGYGRAVTETLVRELAKADVVIISGLALGIDSIAHRAALKAGGTTVAILPTPLTNIYPASHLGLAKQIIQDGGTLISEYPTGSETFPVNFIARNRLVSALADGLLITEAAIKSGTIHTARFALEQGKTVMAVPGNISSPTSAGCNQLIKSGASPVTEAADIFFELGIKVELTGRQLAPTGDKLADKLLELIARGLHDQEELAIDLGLEAARLSSLLTNLEIKGYIRPSGGGQWQLL